MPEQAWNKALAAGAGVLTVGYQSTTLPFGITDSFK
jgi:hypothetical protein